MSVIEYCPVCRYKFSWIASSAKQVQCPKCQTRLVETKRHQSLQRRLWVTYIVMFVLSNSIPLAMRLENSLIMALLALAIVANLFFMVWGLYAAWAERKFAPASGAQN